MHTCTYTKNKRSDYRPPPKRLLVYTVTGWQEIQTQNKLTEMSAAGCTSACQINCPLSH